MVSNLNQSNLEESDVEFSRFTKEAGFSLIEIIIVLGILGSLIAVLVTSLGTSQISAKKKETAVKAGQVQSQLLRYQADMGKMPTTAEGLGVLFTNSGSSKWTGPYGNEDDVKDAFGTAFEYELSPKGAVLKSAGQDEQMGTADDFMFVSGKLVDTDSTAAAPGTGAEAPAAK